MNAGEDRRARILARVRTGAASHPPVAHPGHLGLAAPMAAGAIDTFMARLRAAGGEVFRFGDVADARSWLDDFAADFATAAVSDAVPPPLRPLLEQAAPDAADLGVSFARCAIAETGSLLLDSREGRRLQLLPPVHLVWVLESGVLPTLAQALEHTRDDRGAALGLHSGPSKSADIGGILIRGVHGPGRLVAVIVAGRDVEAGRVV